MYEQHRCNYVLRTMYVQCTSYSVRSTVYSVNVYTGWVQIQVSNHVIDAPSDYVTRWPVHWPSNDVQCTSYDIQLHCTTYNVQAVHHPSTVYVNSTYTIIHNITRFIYVCECVFRCVLVCVCALEHSSAAHVNSMLITHIQTYSIQC